MTDELKPCKRCGASGRAMSLTHKDGPTYYWVECVNEYCGEVTGTYEKPEDAIESWNEPSEEQLLRAEVERLRAQIEAMMDALQTIDQSACYPADVQPDLPRGDAWALIERIHDIAYKAMKGGS